MADTDEPMMGGLDLGLAPKAEPYRVLARKYRPSDFSQLVGQEALVKTLSNAFALGRIAHAFMLTGVRGVGKTTTARIIARALNCTGADGARAAPTVHPCGACDACVAIAESRHVDVQEMDAASRTGIDDIREIIEGVRYAPASARYKVYIIDEVHMLSKAAFNGLLKTLEEPPPHVKFIFATTEIRKVPVTVLSRCQRFDLRRIEGMEIAAHLKSVAAREGVAIEDTALALIARAAEGSMRDGLSLLDQAIAHNESGAIAGDAVRAMLGLADRGRVLDLLEKLFGGDIATALSDLSDLHANGADPLTLIQDLLELTHFLTRLKVAPAAQGFFDGGSDEAARAASIAAKLSVPSLTRAWTMLLKGLIEVRDATRPLAACEMALVRLAYAADLPPTDKLVRDVLDGAPPPRSSSSPAPSSSGNGGGGTRAMAPAQSQPQIQPRAQAQAVPDSAPQLRSLEDMAALAGMSQLKIWIENNMRLVRLEPGRIEFVPSGAAPPGLAAELTKKLHEWTGTRWMVSVAREGGAPTLADQRRAAKQARYEAALHTPMVRAVMDRFPGAEIAGVYDVVPETGHEPGEDAPAEDSGREDETDTEA